MLKEESVGREPSPQLRNHSKNGAVVHEGYLRSFSIPCFSCSLFPSLPPCFLVAQPPLPQKNRKHKNFNGSCCIRSLGEGRGGEGRGGERVERKEGRERERERGGERRGEEGEERRADRTTPDLSFLIGVARGVSLSLQCMCHVSAFGFVDPIMLSFCP